jgi:hypothetical protein
MVIKINYIFIQRNKEVFFIDRIFIKYESY